MLVMQGESDLGLEPDDAEVAALSGGKRICALPEVREQMDEFVWRLNEAKDPRDPAVLCDACAQRPINATELVGTWEPTDQSLNFLFFAKGYHHTGDPHSFTLGIDGKLTFASVIHGNTNSPSGYGYLETVGDWMLTRRDSSKTFSRIQLKLGLEGPRHRIGEQFYIMERRGRLTLWFSIGDPFSNEYLEYQRVTDDGS